MQQSSLYTTTIPPMLAMLRSVRGLLNKASEYVSARGGKEERLLNDCIIFDQFPLVRQVQIMSDAAKGLAARLAGVPIPTMEDTETTIAQLIARIDATIAFIESITAGQIDGKESEVIAMPYMEGKALSAIDYARFYALPNFYFHVVTAYTILRKNGAAIGKNDYLTNLPLVDLPL